MTTENTDNTTQDDQTNDETDTTKEIFPCTDLSTPDPTCSFYRHVKSRWSLSTKLLIFFTIGFLLATILFILNYQLTYPAPINNTTTDIDLLVKSYQTTITSYSYAICVFFGIFTIIAGGTIALNYKAAEKIDAEYAKAARITRNYEQVLKKSLEDIQEKGNQKINSILELTKSNITINNLFNEANRAYEQKEYRDVITLCDKILEINDSIAEVHSNKGNALAEINDFKNAIKAYDKAIEINPNESKAYLNKGITLLKMSNLTKALSCFTKAEDLNPDNSQNYNKACIYSLWLNSDAEASSRPENTLDLCHTHLQQASNSRELQKLGIQHLKTDTDLDPVRNEPWFTEIMHQTFGKDTWDNYPNNSAND